MRHGVVVVGIAAVDHDVALVEHLEQLGEHRVGNGAGRDHGPHNAGSGEGGNQTGHRIDGLDAFGLDGDAGRFAHIEAHYAMPTVLQVHRDVRAHLTQTDDSDLHTAAPFPSKIMMSNKPARRGEKTRIGSLVITPRRGLRKGETPSFLEMKLVKRLIKTFF